MVSVSCRTVGTLILKLESKHVLSVSPERDGTEDAGDLDQRLAYQRDNHLHVLGMATRRLPLMLVSTSVGDPLDIS